jgi:hypothetical protein
VEPIVVHVCCQKRRRLIPLADAEEEDSSALWYFIHVGYEYYVLVARRL